MVTTRRFWLEQANYYIQGVSNLTATAITQDPPLTEEELKEVAVTALNFWTGIPSLLAIAGRK